jgi:beta-glucosidase
MKSPQEANDHARALYAQMTHDERVAVLSGDLHFWPGITDMMKAYNQKPYPSGHLPRLGIRGLQFTDGPRGVGLGRSTCFPVSMGRGATWDTALEQRVGEAIGIEARAQGANLVGAVCINLLRHPAWGRAQETYGEDTHHVGEMGAALTVGIQHHAMACVKHFACNSIDDARFRVDVRVAHDVLDDVYLPHFKRSVDAGVACVMSAYNKVNGDWCAESEHLLDTVLRKRWGFDGFVISDFIFGLRDAKRALRAGLDVEMPFRHLFWNGLRNGEVSPELIERSVLRVLSTQLRFQDVGNAEIYTPETVACAQHRDLARLVATRSMVLLQNARLRGTELLPLDTSRLKRIAVIGHLSAVANLGDRGSSQVHPPYAVTLLDGLRAALPKVSIVYDDGSNIRRACDVARDADVVILAAGMSYRDEGERIAPTFPLPPWRQVPALVRAAMRKPAVYSAGDRVRLALRTHEEQLIRAVAKQNPATVVTLMGGSAMVIESWRREVPAILMAWYPGMEGGHAIADVLLGREEPAGRLPFAWPRSENGLPHFDRNARSIEYGPLHGQRLHDTTGNAPAFALGHGCSYTTFRKTLKNVRKRSHGLRVDVHVENIGPRAGNELIALWGTRNQGPKILAAFGRVMVAPGASDTVTFELRGNFTETTL